MNNSSRLGKDKNIIQDDTILGSLRYDYGINEILFDIHVPEKDKALLLEAIAMTIAVRQKVMSLLIESANNTNNPKTRSCYLQYAARECVKIRDLMDLHAFLSDPYYFLFMEKHSIG